MHITRGVQSNPVPLTGQRRSSSSTSTVSSCGTSYWLTLQYSQVLHPQLHHDFIWQWWNREWPVWVSGDPGAPRPVHGPRDLLQIQKLTHPEWTMSAKSKGCRASAGQHHPHLCGRGGEQRAPTQNPRLQPGRDSLFQDWLLPLCLQHGGAQ